MSEEKKEVFYGKVVWFNPKRGIGFIAKDDGSGDLFCHWSSIVADGFKTLREGQSVQYELGTNSKGVQAVNVRVMDSRK